MEYKHFLGKEQPSNVKYKKIYKTTQYIMNLVYTFWY